MASRKKLFFIFVAAAPFACLCADEFPEVGPLEISNEPTAAAVGNFWKEDYVNGIVAVANGKPITAGELRQELLPLIGRIEMEAASQEDFDARVHAVAGEILRHMIDRALIVQEFEKNGMQIPDQQKNFYLDEFIRNRFDGDRTAFIGKLREYGKTLGQFKKEIEESFIVDAMEGRIRSSRSEISPSQLKAYYEEHREEFTVPAAIRIGQIFLGDGGEDPNAVVEQLAAGEEFITLRDRLSPETASMDGDWVQLGDMRPEFAALEELPVGAHSEPIAVSRGILIAAVLERRESSVRPLEEVQDEIESRLIRRRVGGERERWLAGLRQNSYVKTYL
ncbi:MAG: peptidyl-prolyl cis-trans isomerase [Puniceicoccales bacterium]|jgi:peptidyl-prolyl cis-trans isomerase SurA|nr:peptidyl-prolyl cis-trans isomerase [Puniceicoccales bacterium]